MVLLTEKDFEFRLGCPPIAPETRPCSGHGSCIVDRCVCDEGWSGKSDFMVLEGLDCGIRIDAIRYMWIHGTVGAVIGFIGYVLRISLVIFYRYRVAKSKEELSSSVMKSARYVFNQSLMQDISALFCCFFICWFGILKLIDPIQYSIGNNNLTTILFSVFASFFWICSISFYSVTMQLVFKQAFTKAVHQRERIKKVFRIQRFLMPLISVLTMLGCIIPLTSLSLASPFAVYISGVIHFTLLGFLMFFCILFILPQALIYAAKDLQAPKEMLSNNNVHLIMYHMGSKFLRFASIIRQQGVQQSFMAIIVGLWPYLTTKCSYELPIAWGFVGYVLLFAVYLKHNVVKDTNAIQHGNDDTLTNNMQKMNNNNYKVVTPSPLHQPGRVTKIATGDQISTNGD